MNDGIVRKWVRAFKDGRKNVHDEERSVAVAITSGGKYVTKV